MAPLSVEKGLATRDELRYDKRVYPHLSLSKKIKYCIGAAIYFIVATCIVWALAIRRSSGCGNERSALASIPFIVTFFAMSAMPPVFMLSSATSRSAAAALLYFGAFIVALAILIFSWGIEAIKPEGSACMIKPAYDAGVCTVVDVNNTNDVEWMKTCKLFGEKDYAFFYKGMVEKYRVDMVAFYAMYGHLKALATNSFLEEFVLYPVDKDLPSILDMVICYAAFMPCSASCMPIKPCKTIVRDGLKRLVKHERVQSILDSDCRDVVGDLDLRGLLNLAGFDEAVTRTLLDVLEGVSESCTSFLKYVFEDTNIDSVASSLCTTISNYTTAYDMDRIIEDGKCTESAYLKVKRVFDEEKDTREKSISDWERRALITVFVAHGILLIAAIMILSKFIARENKVSATTDSIIKHNTPASVVCSCIAFTFGICILAISLGYFLWLRLSFVCLRFSLRWLVVNICSFPQTTIGSSSS